MTTMVRGARYRNARVARPIFDLLPAQADQLRAVSYDCARPLCEVYT